MSTKSTIACGESFHLYQECFDESNIYLELPLHPQFEVSEGQVTVAIPLEVWEVARRRTFIDLSLVDKTDDQIRQMVEAHVSDRLDRVKEAEAKGQDPGMLLSWGLLAYGSADDPVQEQVRMGIEYYTKRRQFQQELAARIKALEGAQRKASGKDSGP